ncbi:MAG: B12-binding domain-containing radical SAM protein [Chitinispirillales bacterium]|nr:B12-binding domain-containing radical SAM protein [Chitinispirillales bacterium]
MSEIKRAAYKIVTVDICNKMKKNILFYPRGYDNSIQKIRINELTGLMPPLGLASIAAVIRQKGHEIQLIDACAHLKVTNSQWAEKLAAAKPDFVGFSATTPSFNDAYDVCKKLKEIAPEIKTVFGGIHVSALKERILQNYSAIDFIVVGEGEFAFCDIIDSKKTEEIPGVFSRIDKSIVGGKPQSAKTLCNMDDLPFPAYDLIDGFPKKYNMALFSYPQFPTANIISSRGCVYHCSFCDRSVYKTSFRWNSPEYTCDLVKYLSQNFGIKHIMFYDDLFTLNRERVSKLCKLLRTKTPKITFNCIVRIGHIDKELIAELKSAGCWMVHCGIESGDQETLNKHKENLSLEQIRNDVEMLHKSGLWVKGLFMMGFPSETEESFRKTIDFAVSLPLKDANLTSFTPYPGAPVYCEIEEHGEFDKSPRNWNNCDCVMPVFVPYTMKSKEKMSELYGEFIRKFYNRPFAYGVYNKMFIQCPHSYWRLLKNLPIYLKYATQMKFR